MSKHVLPQTVALTFFANIDAIHDVYMSLCSLTVRMLYIRTCQDIEPHRSILCSYSLSSRYLLRTPKQLNLVDTRRERREEEIQTKKRTHDRVVQSYRGYDAQYD